MNASFLGNRALVLGLVAALGIVAPKPADGGPTTPSPTRKSSGELDPSFAGDGTTWSYLPGPSGPPVNNDVAEAVAVDAAGGILVAAHGPSTAFAIVRHDAYGARDWSFGSNGLAAPFAGRDGEVAAMAIQPDGRIVVAGYSPSFAVARLMPDGSPDPGFGSGGEVLSVFPPPSPYTHLVHDMALQADGRIVVAGEGRPAERAPQPAASSSNSGAPDVNSSAPEVPPSGTFATLARYNTDGSPDTTFGAGGLAFSSFPDSARAVAVQPDGRIVVAGLYFDVTRFNANGTIDTGFGSQGRVVVPFGDELWNSVANAILVQPDGRIVVAGAYGHDFAVARLNPDGSLDKGFGKDGMVTTDFNAGTDSVEALVLQADGRLVAAGFGATSHRPPDETHFALARYEPDGALDRSFGRSGRATAEIDGPVFNDFARALAAQPDGRLVAAGNIHIVCEVDGCNFSGYALARFFP